MLVAGQHVGPGQGHDLGDAETSGVGDLEQNAITPGGRSTQQQLDVNLRDDALGQVGAPIGRIGAHLDGSAGVEKRIAGPLSVPEQGFHAQDILPGAGFRLANADLGQRIPHIFDCGLAHPHRELDQEAPGRDLEVAPREIGGERSQPGAEQLLVRIGPCRLGRGDELVARRR